MVQESQGDGQRILVVDDELAIRRLMSVALGSYGYKVLEASSGREAIVACAIDHPDAVVLDLGLPDMDGHEVICRLREWSQVPIIVLSVRQHEEDKVRALDAGANDFVTKPFSVPELCARLRVATRATSPGGVPVLALTDSITLDKLAHRVTRNGEDVRLTPTEYSLLVALTEHPGRVVTHRQLLRTVWGPGHESSTEYLRLYFAQLRKKLEDDPAYPKLILTEPGVGYRSCQPPRGPDQ